MKLRIDENRIRLRLTQGEPERLVQAGCVSGQLDMGPAPDMPFRYTLVTAQADSATLHHRDGELRVRIPLAWAKELAAGTRSERAFEPPQENGAQVRVVIECDLPCAHRAPVARCVARGTDTPPGTAP